MKLIRGPKTWNPLKDRLWAFIEKVSGPLRIAGILLSVLSMHLLVVRPLVERVGQLESELHEIDSTLEKLAQSRETIRETNSLLENLKSQHEELARARATVRQLQVLRKEIVAEAEQIPAAMQSLKRISELPNQVFESEVERYSQFPAAQGTSLPVDLKSVPMPIRIQDKLSDPQAAELDEHAPRLVTTPRELFHFTQ